MEALKDITKIKEGSISFKGLEKYNLEYTNVSVRT